MDGRLPIEEAAVLGVEGRAKSVDGRLPIAEAAVLGIEVDNGEATCSNSADVKLIAFSGNKRVDTVRTDVKGGRITKSGGGGVGVPEHGETLGDTRHAGGELRAGGRTICACVRFGILKEVNLRSEL